MTLVLALLALSLCGHVVGAFLLVLCRREARLRDEATAKRIAKAESRLAAFEDGTVYRQMQHFCDEMAARVAQSRAELEDAQKRLGASLLQLADAEERVARMLSAGVP